MSARVAEEQEVPSGPRSAAEEVEEAVVEQEEVKEPEKPEEEEQEEEKEEEEAPREEVREDAGSNLETVACIPETVSDFLRNFLRRAGLHRSLDCFEAEWYGSASGLSGGIFLLPDAVTHRELLRAQLDEARREAAALRLQVLAAGESLVRIQRERDVHQLQYMRVLVEKKGLAEDIRQLRRHLETYEPAMVRLEAKYQAALRQNLRLNLEKDRAQAQARSSPAPAAATRDPSWRKKIRWIIG